MCPFALQLSSFLLTDAQAGLYSQDVIETVTRAALQWRHRYAAGEVEFDKTGTRLALAALTVTNAVLGRASTPRTTQQMVDGLRTRSEELSLLKTEQEILRGWSDDGQTGHVARAEHALALAIDLEMFLAGRTMRREDVQSTFAMRGAEDFFTFAQRECVTRGHGLPGLHRAIGIVIGEVTIEEVVFG